MAQQCVVHKLAISFSSLISAEKFHSPVCAPVKRFSLSPPCKCRRMKGFNLPFWHIINIQHQCQHHHTFIGFYCFIWFCCFICLFFRWFVLKLKPRTSLQVWARRVVKDLWGWAIFTKDHVFFAWYLVMTMLKWRLIWAIEIVKVNVMVTIMLTIFQTRWSCALVNRSMVWSTQETREIMPALRELPFFCMGHHVHH